MRLAALTAASLSDDRMLIDTTPAFVVMVRVENQYRYSIRPIRYAHDNYVTATRVIFASVAR